jgi:predicted dithiol-disulfide oxidoreductase (DUF899 family)
MRLLKIFPRDEWLVARKALLIKRVEMTRARGAPNVERRRLQTVRIAKDNATLVVSR